MKTSLSLTAFVSLAGLTLADERFTTLVLEGDNLTGIGAVTQIENLAINDAGQWVVEARTDADPTVDAVMIRDGAVYLRQGDPVAQPVGATLSMATSPLIPFDSFRLDSSGRAIYTLTLENTAGGTTDNAGIYLDAHLSLQKGLVLNGAPGFGNGSILGSFSDAKLNENNQLLVVGTMDDTNVPGTSDWYVMRVQLNGSGDPVSLFRIAGEGDTLPGQSEVVNTIRSSPHANAINASGDVIFGADLQGDSNFDAVVYLNTTVIAQQGMPSPVPGRQWGDVIAPECDLNDAGDWTLKDKLDNSDTSTDEIIVKNGMKFIQEGETLPAISPDFFTYFGNGPACLTAAGDVLWYGEWDDGDSGTPEQDGLFLGDQLIVQSGVTQIGGVTVDQVGFQSENYFISPNGRFVIFEATLENGLEGAFLLDLQAPTTFCDAVPNSTGLTGSMGNSGSLSISANDFVLTASNLPAGQNGLFIYSPTPQDPGIPLGNGVLCLSNQPLGFILRLPPETSDAGGVMTHALDNTAPPHPDGLLTPGSTWYFSCWHRDNPAPPSFFNFANGLAATFEP